MGRLWLVVAIVVLGSTFAAAQTEEVGTEIEDRRSRLEAIEAVIADSDSTEDLIDLNEEIRDIRREAELALPPLELQLKAVNTDLEALGPPPEEGAAEETELLQEERAELNREKARLEAQIAQIELNLTSANRAAEAISVRRREEFTGQLTSRGPLLFAPRVWSEAIDTFRMRMDAGRGGVNDWFAARRAEGQLVSTVVSLLIAIGLALGVMIPFRRVVDRQMFARLKTLEPLPSRRVLLAAIRTALNLFGAVIAGFFILEALRINGAVTDQSRPVIIALWLGYVVYALVSSAVSAVFAPGLPAWRLAPLRTGNVLVVRSLALSAVAVLVIGNIINAISSVLGSSPSFDYLVEGVTGVVLGVLLILLARAGLWSVPGGEEDEELPETGAVTTTKAPPGAPVARVISSPDPAAEEKDQGRTFWKQLRVAGRVIGATSILAAVTGYVDLSYYFTTRSFVLLALFGVVFALRALIREVVRFFDRGFSSAAAQDEAEDDRLLYSWIGIGIDLLTVAIFVPPALLVLGASWPDVRAMVIDAFLGFNIGSVRISFAKIFSAVATFAILLWLTRAAQKTADAQLFPRSRMDKGVQNSLRTLIGYLGLIIAGAAGISALGFNLSNLAIIAGALSVGIGFGLQSIVNNFVSGLILLFERPIKVGDWIVTGSGEGIVKKISVRSTEIETFDRSSVIVPNSELIAQAVTNWTHKDRMGRVMIAVGAAYSSDAAKVVEVLEDVARQSRDVLGYPAPFVVFEDFGASSLDFTLRVYIRDVGETLRVRTRLRLAIHKRFKEEGIEIPFPQRDLNVRGLAEEILEENRGGFFTDREAAE